MGLLDWLRNRSNGEDEVDYEQYSGMRFEVMDDRERLIFIAFFTVGDDGTVVLRPIVPPRYPPTGKYYPVLMRGYQQSTKKAIHMEGDISPAGNGNWLVDELKVTGVDNDRAFYRQVTSVGGMVVPMHQRGLNAIPCRVLNISAGGVCIQTGAECMVGEKMMLRTTLFDDWRIAPQMCTVRRATRRRTLFEYGCEFSDLSPGVEEHISKSIMEMQRERKYGV